MKIVVGLATFEGREKSLKDAVKSLEGQVDEIFIYDNSKNKDVKDNGKFYGLTQIKEPCVYLTCDDDIIYPPDYVESILGGINEFKCIVTHHGKSINSKDYLEDSKSYHFSVRNYKNIELDVAGTGITGFRTDYFNPVELFENDNYFVSDLLLAIEASKKNKRIMLLKHPTNWIKQNMDIDFQKSISYIEEKDRSRQNKFKNELLNGRYSIKYR